MYTHRFISFSAFRFGGLKRLHFSAGGLSQVWAYFASRDTAIRFARRWNLERANANGDGQYFVLVYCKRFNLPGGYMTRSVAVSGLASLVEALEF